MISSKKSKRLFIDAEALSTLAFVQEGLLYPIKGLMGRDEAREVDRDKSYKGFPFPFSFILAPNGKKNRETLNSLSRGERIIFICEDMEVGELTVDEVFEIDKSERVLNIYGSTDQSHPGVKNTTSRLGELAVSGEYSVDYPPLKKTIWNLKDVIKKVSPKKISAMMLAANPLNRAHERVIRQSLVDTDLLILFLRKPFTSDGLSFDIRFKALDMFVENFLPKNRAIIVPFENTYIFAGYNELILEAIMAKNYGCNELIIGKNHAGLGLYYDKNQLNTVFDTLEGVDIKVTTIDEYVYCDICKTLVSNSICPHGQHHHINYHSESIRKLIMNGILPPPILVRKEITANILSSLHLNRVKDLQNIYYSLIPTSGLLEDVNEEQFYIKLMELYQTSSLT
jgi:sulfate adenylyltransferase